MTGPSERWLQQYVNETYTAVPESSPSWPRPRFTSMIEYTEAWSFVRSKDDKRWIWFALDRETREVVGVHVGDRSDQGAQALWDSLLEVYREHARCYTDLRGAYQAILPADRHQTVGKDSGKSNRIERHNGTLRLRVSRCVRKT